MWQRIRGWFGRLPAFVRWNCGCSVLFIGLCLGCLGVMAIWPEEAPTPTSEAPAATERPAGAATSTPIAPKRQLPTLAPTAAWPTLAPTAGLPTLLPSRTPPASVTFQATSAGAASLQAAKDIAFRE